METPALTDGEPRSDQSTAARLWAHAGALWLLLLVLMPFVGVHRAPFIGDEGGLLMQLDTLAETGGWWADNPLADLDPDGRYVGIRYAHHEDGRIVAFRGRPTYVLTNLGPYRLGGVWGVTALGTLAVAATSLLVAFTSRYLRPGSEYLALWLTGVGTPLVFHGYVLQGHTVAAAAVSAILFATVRLSRAEAPRVVVTAAALVPLLVLAVSIRRETAFLALGVLGWSIVAYVVDRSRAVLLVGAAVAVSAPLGLMLDRVLIGLVTGSGSSAGTPAAGSSALSYVDGRLTSSYITVIAPGLGDLTTSDLALFVAAMVTLLGAFKYRRRGELPLLVIGVALVTLAAAMNLVQSNEYVALVPGILTAAPLLFAGAIVCPADIRRSREGRLLFAAAAATAIGVMATQYPVGGGGEWGGRFFAVAIPPVGVMAASGWSAVLGTAPHRRWLGGLLAACVAITAVLALTSQQELRHRSADATEQTIAEANERGGLIISTDASAGRHDTTQLDHVDHRWASVTIDQLDGFLAAVDRLAISDAVLVTPAEHVARITPILESAGWQVEDQTDLPLMIVPTKLLTIAGPE